tara:strand:+ start:204 stop:494 length:291 start_codon:yes stop_codon:yes gene_type:complete
MKIKGLDWACNNGSMNNPQRKFPIRLISFLSGGSWSDPHKLWLNMPSDFEIVRRSPEENVIPISSKTEEAERLISEINRRKKESNGKIKIYINSHL